MFSQTLALIAHLHARKGAGVLDGHLSLWISAGVHPFASETQFWSSEPLKIGHRSAATVSLDAEAIFFFSGTWGDHMTHQDHQVAKQRAAVSHEHLWDAAPLGSRGGGFLRTSGGAVRVR